MARRFLDRSLVAPVLLLNFALNVFILSIAGWALDNMINGTAMEGGNAATPNLVLMVLLAGVVGIASILAALRLVKDWNRDNVAAATASGLIAWTLLLLAFGLACKEISIGSTGTTLKFMEIFVITLTITHTLYLLVLHGGSLGL